MIKVVSGDKEYHVPYPCRMWLRDWIETWLKSGNEIAPFSLRVPTRAELRGQINAHYDKLRLGVFTDSNGHRYDVHADARANITGQMALITYAQGKGETIPVPEWTDADNIQREHDMDTFASLSLELGAWTSALHNVCIAKKAEVDSLAEEDLAAYDVTAGWPE